MMTVSLIRERAKNAAICHGFSLLLVLHPHWGAGGLVGQFRTEKVNVHLENWLDYGQRCQSIAAGYRRGHCRRWSATVNAMMTPNLRKNDGRIN